MRCKICASDRRAALEQALEKGLSLRAAAQQFGFSPSGVDRHRRRCACLESQRLAPGSSQVGLRRLWEALQRVLRRAEAGGDVRGALEAISKLHEIEKKIVRGPLQAPGGTIPQVPTPDLPSDVAARMRAGFRKVLIFYLRTFIHESEGDADERVQRRAILAARLVTLLEDRPPEPELDAALDAAEHELDAAPAEEEEDK